MARIAKERDQRVGLLLALIIGRAAAVVVGHHEQIGVVLRRQIEESGRDPRVRVREPGGEDRQASDDAVAGVELDDTIPIELYEAVAEVIGFVLRARTRMS